MASQRWASMADAEEFFSGNPLGLATFHRVHDIVGECGGAELRVAETQVGWARRRGFAFLWSASRWLGDRGSPCVLTVALPERHPYLRWTQVVRLRPNLWTHHLEVSSVDDIDEAVQGWIAAAYRAAG